MDGMAGRMNQVAGFPKGPTLLPSSSHRTEALRFPGSGSAGPTGFGRPWGRSKVGPNSIDGRTSQDLAHPRVHIRSRNPPPMYFPPLLPRAQGTQG